MHVLLIAPPVANPYYPPLGLPSLAAHLRESSRHTCSVVDLSIEAIRHILRPAFLSACASKAQTTIDALGRQQALPAEIQEQYVRTTRSLLRAPSTIERIEKAVGLMCGDGPFGDHAERAVAIKTIDQAFELVSSAHSPFALTTAELLCGDAPFSMAALRKCVEEGRSPFCSFLEARLEELIAKERPTALGISVNYYGQLLAALEALRYLRRSHPAITTIVGGGLTPEVGTLLATDSCLSPLIDFVIAYEGETALAELLDRLESGGGRTDLRSNPTRNLMVPTGGSAAVPLRHREDVSSLPVPDFSDLDLDAYLSPQPVIPLLTSRGCYWGACAFCTHYHTYGPDYRTLDGPQVVSAMAQIQSKYGAKHFYFVDESLAPSKARAISEELLARNVIARWGTELRFEKALTDEIIELMARSGCKVLSFGLESGSQRVLDLMDKGIQVEDVHRVLDALARHGIFAHVMCIIGFPGETAHDVDLTVQLLAAHGSNLAMVGFSPFTLNKNSIVHRNPGRFGITRIFKTDALRPDLNFSTRTGLSQAHSVQLFDDIERSALIRSIDSRHAVATREHFLLLEHVPAAGRGTDEHRPSRDASPADFYEADVDNVLIRRLPFSIARAQAGYDWVQENRKAGRLGGQRPPVPPPVLADTCTVVYVERSDKLFEISSEMEALLTYCAQRRSVSEMVSYFAPVAGLTDDADAARVSSMLETLAAEGLLRSKHGEPHATAP